MGQPVLISWMAFRQGFTADPFTSTHFYIKSCSLLAATHWPHPIALKHPMPLYVIMCSASGRHKIIYDTFYGQHADKAAIWGRSAHIAWSDFQVHNNSCANLLNLMKGIVYRKFWPQTTISFSSTFRFAMKNFASRIFIRKFKSARNISKSPLFSALYKFGSRTLTLCLPQPEQAVTASGAKWKIWP